MAPRRRRRQKRSQGRGRGSLSTWFEWRPSTVTEGSSLVISASNIEAPRDRAYKLIFATVDIVADGPMIVQVRLFGPTTPAEANATSGPVCVGVCPRVIRVRSPPSTDWFPKGIDTKWPIVVVDALCEAKTAKYRAVFSAKLKLLLSPEEIPENCPQFSGRVVSLGEPLM